MKIAFVTWHDAHTFSDQVPLSALGEEPCELHEVGFLLKQTKEHIVLGMERQRGMTEARFTLTIPRVNIVDLRVVDHTAAFPKTSRRKAS